MAARFGETEALCVEAPVKSIARIYAVVEEVEAMAKDEQRTKSELLREMVRVYRRYREQRDRDEERWVTKVIAEAKAEQAQNPMSVEEMLTESDRLAKYGEEQARKSRVPTDMKSIDRIVHERRKARRS